MNVGNRIAKLRNDKNISQEELASLLFVSRDLISKWENGKRRPDHEMLKKICEVFSVETDYFESEQEAMIRELSKCIPKEISISEEKYLQLINEFLWTLPERERNVFIRRYYYLETSAQIGDRYIFSPAHVRMLLSRARRKFSQFLKEKNAVDF